MEHELATVTLKSAEPMTLVKVVAPAPSWKDRILPFLGHKGDPWIWGMDLALEHGVKGAAMNFYEGLLPDGTLIGNITTVESLDPPLGLLQHVFTDPDHRRKGVCRALMAALTDDFASRHGRAMFLHTGYDSPAYWIYHSFGFRGHRDTGTMAWVREQGFRDRLFATRPTMVRDTHWGDWAPLEALAETEHGWHLRSVYLGKYGFSGFEGDYLRLRRDVEQGRLHQLKVLATEDGAVAGYAFLAALQSWPGEPTVLDFFVHPSFYQGGEMLLQALDLPPGRKLLAFADSASQGRPELLASIGFALEATLTQQLTEPHGRPLDLLIFSAYSV